MSIYDFNSMNPHIIKCGWLNESSGILPGADFGLRRVKWHEIELTTWGEGKIITEGRHIPTLKGNLFFRRPGMEVRGFSPYHCYVIVFDMVYDLERSDGYNNQEDMNNMDESNSLEATDMLYGNFCGLNFPDVYKTEKFDEFHDLFKSIYEIMLYQKKDAELHVKALLLQILINAYEEYSSSGSITEASRSVQLNRPRIHAVKKYIDANPGKWFSLTELAGYTGLSKNFFCRIFHEIIGETPVEYMNRKKINAAKKLLIETNYSIKEIAYELGFENDTYLYSLFKKTTGMTPTEFKQKQSIFHKHTPIQMH